MELVDENPDSDEIVAEVAQDLLEMFAIILRHKKVGWYLWEMENI